jgi:hypothetical protein
MLRRAFAVVIATALSVSVPVCAQTSFVLDTFTVGANTLLEAHAPNTGGAWTRQVGGSGITINAAADNARNVANNDWNVYTNATTAPAAQITMGATVTFTNTNANNYVDLFGRGSVSLLNAYSVRLAANGAVTLTRWTGGAATTLAAGTVTIALNTPIQLILSLKNASKEVDVNGTAIVSSADNTVAGAGIVALGMNSNNAAQLILDDFFASTFAPTAVDRLDARATRDGSRALIFWTTARETQSLGFRLWRDDGGRRVPLGRGLIAGAAFLVANGVLPAGNSYRWIDDAPSGGAYWIEAIDVRGRASWHGPIAARRGAIDARAARSPAFVDLRQRSGVAARTRLAPAPLAETPPGRRRAANASAAMLMQWQIAAGESLKISIDADGLYRVSRAELESFGFDADRVRLFADGVEVPIAVDGDGILFYATALDTPSTGTRTLFLVRGDGGARMAAAASSAAAPPARRSFTAVAERRDKMFFVTFLREPVGDNFVGPLVSSDAAAPTTQTLQLPHIDRTAAAAKLTVSLQGADDDETSSPHRVAVSLNGRRVGEVDFAGIERPAASFDVPVSLLADGDNVVSFVTLDGDADISTVVSAAIAYEHTFDADDGRLLAVVDGGTTATINGLSCAGLEVLDVTDERAPIRVAPLRAGGGSITFTAPGAGPRTIDVQCGGQAAAVAHSGGLATALHNQHADVLIVTHPSFIAALAPLVQLRQSQGLSVLVAQTGAVYDEFSFGAKDPQAIRALVRSVKPRYVLLVGDASFDARNYLGFGDFDFVPTKLVASDLIFTASDTWFTDFDTPIGRLPVRTLDDARAEAGKIVMYETSAMPAPKTVMLVSDADAALDFHAAAATLAADVPAGYEIADVDAMQSGAAAAKQQLLAGFAGALVVDYIGHGSVESWSNDRLLGPDDVASLPQTSRPPIVVAMTCLNGYFHDVFTESLAETLLRAPNGAVAVWASSALTSPEAQLPVNEVFLRALLAPGEVRLGDAVAAAQRSAYAPDLRSTFLLFGDPAMRVAR